MGKNKHTGGGAGMSSMTKTIKGTFKRKTPKNTQQGDSDEEPDEEIPRRKKGGNSVKRNKRLGRNTRRRSILVRVYGKKNSKTKTK